jgi:hypothetical protein
MAEDWRLQLEHRLVSAIDVIGAWGYRVDCACAAEPTALGALALASSDRHTEQYERALNWLARSQREDGAVPVVADLESPHWTTALALLAWASGPESTRHRYRPQIERARGWLLHAKGRSIEQDPLMSHDTTLVGWPWVSGTHSWIEPTAYAIMALRATGDGEHSRVREAVRLVVDRTPAGGGWNYGNQRAFGQTLHAFPATTGIALTALAGEPPQPCVEAGLQYLEAELLRVRAPLSVSWGLMGMRAWDALPASAESWLERIAQRLADQLVSPHYLAMLLLAGMESCPLVKLTEAEAHV